MAQAYQPPRELPLPREQRDAFRAKLMARTPRWYSPYWHLGLTSVFGVAVVIAALATVRALHPLELLTILASFLISNATEWRAHKDLLHQRSPIAPVLYDRHTPIHHVLFVTEDMEVREPGEWRMVLIPPYGVMLIAVANAPLAAGIRLAGYPNIAALFLASNVAYVVMYEWLHLAYHLPQQSWVGRLGLVRALRRHHAIHHDPRLMQRYNFNVTIPLWDLVRRTYVGASERESAAHAGVKS